jgi:hypothetical protein
VKRIIAPADLRLRPRSGVIAHEPSLSSDLSRKLKTTTRRGVEAGRARAVRLSEHSLTSDHHRQVGGPLMATFGRVEIEVPRAALVVDRDGDRAGAMREAKWNLSCSQAVNSVTASRAERP